MTIVSCHLQYPPQQQFFCCIQICAHLKLLDIMEMVFNNTGSVLLTIAYTWTIIIYILHLLFILINRTSTKSPPVQRWYFEVLLHQLTEHMWAINTNCRRR